MPGFDPNAQPSPDPPTGRAAAGAGAEANPKGATPDKGKGENKGKDQGGDQNDNKPKPQDRVALTAESLVWLFGAGGLVGGVLPYVYRARHAGTPRGPAPSWAKAPAGGALLAASLSGVLGACASFVPLFALALVDCLDSTAGERDKVLYVGLGAIVGLLVSLGHDHRVGRAAPPGGDAGAAPAPHPLEASQAREAASDARAAARRASDAASAAEAGYAAVLSALRAGDALSGPQCADVIEATRAAREALHPDATREDAKRAAGRLEAVSQHPGADGHRLQAELYARKLGDPQKAIDLLGPTPPSGDPARPDYLFDLARYKALQLAPGRGGVVQQDVARDALIKLISEAVEGRPDLLKRAAYEPAFQPVHDEPAFSKVLQGLAKQ